MDQPRLVHAARRAPRAARPEAAGRRAPARRAAARRPGPLPLPDPGHAWPAEAPAPGGPESPRAGLGAPLPWNGARFGSFCLPLRSVPGGHQHRTVTVAVLVVTAVAVS